jgi:TolB protein
VESRIRRVVSLATVALAVALLTAAAATAGASAPARWIVFSATPSGQHVDQLYRIHPSGADLQQITKGPYASIAPAFSPDGKRIAFARTGVGIVTMNLDGTGLHRLTTNGRDGFPAWSPDGKQIAFVRPYKAEWTLFVMTSSGAAERRLPKAPPSGRPTWVASGILVPSGGDLLKTDTKTGRVLKYYDAQIDAVWGMNSVAISPNQTTMTYVGGRDPIAGDKECGEGPCQRFALYKESLVANKKTPQRVVKDAGPATYSPNGKQLVFVSNGGLVLWSLADGASKALTTGDSYPTVAAPPVWQP